MLKRATLQCIANCRQNLTIFLLQADGRWSHPIPRCYGETQWSSLKWTLSFLFETEILKLFLFFPVCLKPWQSSDKEINSDKAGNLKYCSSPETHKKHQIQPYKFHLFIIFILLVELPCASVGPAQVMQAIVRHSPSNALDAYPWRVTRVRRTKSRGQKGLQLDVRARSAPRLLSLGPHSLYVQHLWSLSCQMW